MKRTIRKRGLLIVVLLVTAGLAAVALCTEWGNACIAAVSAKVTVERVGKIAIEILLILPLAFLIEGLAIGWRRSSFRRLFRPSCSAQVDLLIYAAGEARLPGILLTILAAVGVTGLTLLGNGLLAERLGIANWTRIDNPILAFLVFLVVRDFGYYWYHRMQHTRVFWPLHRLHHSASEFTVLTSYRTNLLGEILLGTFQAIPLSFLTLPEPSLIAGQLLVVFHGHLIHSEWRSRWGWAGRWLLMSPLHHRLHHGMRAHEYKSNFATMPLWDRVFGTFREPQDSDIAIGVSHPAYDTLAGCARMIGVEFYETARLLVGLPVHDPSVGGQAVASVEADNPHMANPSYSEQQG